MMASGVRVEGIRNMLLSLAELSGGKKYDVIMDLDGLFTPGLAFPYCTGCVRL
jgi:hypothetical protein